MSVLGSLQALLTVAMSSLIVLDYRHAAQFHSDTLAQELVPSGPSHDDQALRSLSVGNNDAQTVDRQRQTMTGIENEPDATRQDKPDLRGSIEALFAPSASGSVDKTPNSRASPLGPMHRAEPETQAIYIPSALISATTMPESAIETATYATINYNGLIGVNATDPYAITTESRSFSLPLEVQVSGLQWSGLIQLRAAGLMLTNRSILNPSPRL